MTVLSPEEKHAQEWLEDSLKYAIHIEQTVDDKDETNFEITSRIEGEVTTENWTFGYYGIDETEDVCLDVSWDNDKSSEDWEFSATFAETLRDMIETRIKEMERP